MVGLIAKIGAFFGIIIFGILLALNITNKWNPGTLRLTAPDVAPCHRLLETRPDFKGREPQLVQVRWIMTEHNYGWGCYFEFGDFKVETVTPMPE